ncbi:MAG: winged helix-turn-helix domain-containing protein [Nitrososphaerota archaeon]|nr:winged helix-turn-helix domain-containing protein [Nitrososphaerota archaeon]
MVKNNTADDDDLDKRIRSELESDPTVRGIEIARRLDRNDATISKHLSRLKEEGLVAGFRFCDEHGLMRDARFPLPSSSIKLEPKTDLDIDLKPVQRTNFLHLQAIPNGEYGRCRLSVLVQNNRGNEGMGVSWRWGASEPERELHPLEKVEVRLMDLLYGGIAVTREDGKIARLYSMSPSKYFVILVSISDKSGRQLRTPYLISRKSEFLSQLYQIAPEKSAAGGGEAQPEPVLREPITLLSDIVEGAYQHSEGMVAEIEEGRYAAFVVGVGSLGGWDSYMGKLQADFLLDGMHIPKAVEGTDGQPRYEITLEVRHKQEAMRFLVLDERAVQGGWMDDYAHFHERVESLAKKHGVDIEFTDADLWKDGLDRCSLETGGARQAHAYGYFGSSPVVGLFMLERLHGR